MSGKEVDYSITPVSFYKFVCNNVEIKSTYVGHTTNFITRKSSHKHSCNKEHEKGHHFKIYQTIRDNGGWDNWRMIEIEKRLVKDKREAERIEQEFMEQLQSDLNMYKSYNPNYHISQEYKEQQSITKKAYRKEHNEELAIYNKEYSEKHKEEIAIYHKEWCDKNKEQLAIYHKEWCDKNKEQLAIYKKAWYERKKERNLMSQEDKRY